MAAANPPAAPLHLVVRLRNWVGDVVLGLPTLAVLDQAGFSLTLVARGRWAPSLLQGLPWPVVVQPSGLWARVTQLSELRDRLSASDPSFLRRLNTLVLPQSFSSALEVRLAGLRAIGHANEGRSLLLSHSIPLPTEGHVAWRYFALSQRLLGLLQPDVQHHPALLAMPKLHLPVSKAAETAAQQLLQHHGVRQPYLMVCPFAGGKSATGKLDKSWPHFPEFVALAAQRLGLALVLCPGPGEVDQAQSTYPAALCLSGCTLDTYAALLQSAALVVAIDTGPAHMAAAVGARVLSIMGPTLASHWRPLGPTVELIPGHPLWPTPQHVLERCTAALAASLTL